MPVSIVDLFDISVKKNPHSIAITHKDQSVTYSELWEKANRFSSFLVSKKFKQGDRVAILIENSIDYVLLYYGILIAGGVVVALNTAVKPRDILNWIRHSQATWFIGTSRNPDFMTICQSIDNSVNIVNVNKAKDEIQAYRLSEIMDDEGYKHQAHSIRRENNAAIIYTSGTTGKPKGVTLSHGNLVTNIKSILEYLKLTKNDRCMTVLPFYYSYGNSILHTHLAVGGSLILENSLLYPHVIVKKMDENKTTGFSGVPSTFALLLSRVNFADYDLSSMRYVTQAGGPMPPPQIRRWIDVMPNAQFFVMYGQTEASARLSYLPPNMLQEKMGSVGIPIPGVQIEIRDEDGAKVAPGICGEIYAKGENIMQGYWRDKTNTRKVLIDGWLKTGDLARMDEDGYIFIEGRQSDMIKSGAHRISPSDIEEVIMELNTIADVAALGLPDDILGQIIKVVIIKKDGVEVTEKQIKAHCRQTLASYKVPKIIEFATELPRTSSGKLKRFMLTNT